MGRKPGNARTDEQKRARFLAEQKLIAAGMPEVQAQRWCSAWEAEAARQRISPRSEYFWDAGLGWIDAQRSFVGSTVHHLERIAG